MCSNLDFSLQIDMVLEGIFFSCIYRHHYLKTIFSALNLHGHLNSILNGLHQSETFEVQQPLRKNIFKIYSVHCGVSMWKKVLLSVLQIYACSFKDFYTL